MADVIRELRRKMQAQEKKRQARSRFWKIAMIATVLMVAGAMASAQ